MRTFISIDIPKEIQEKIGKIQDSLPEFIGKKIELENLHLTLKFLGEVDKKILSKVKGKLKEIKFRKFEVKVDSIGVFSEEFVRIVWLRLCGIEKLQSEVDNALNELFEKEKRFMSHLTIARVKQVKNKKNFLSELNEIKFDKLKFVVENFKLKRSVLYEKGPSYEDIFIYNAIE